MKSLSNYIPNTLAQQVDVIRRLNHVLPDCLPSRLLEHAEIVSVQNTTLTVAADSPAWASKLRYYTRNLAESLSKKTGLNIESVKIMIRPATASSHKNRREKPYFSKNSAQLLKTLADNVKHSALQRALKSLAQHGQAKD